MSNADIRKAHKLLDYVSQGRAVLDEEIELLRSFLPERPKQKTLEEITEHVRNSWVGTSGNEWAGSSYNTEITLESWLGELYVQLQGLKDVPANTPALPAGMRLAEHEEYGRVVVSPSDDESNDAFRIFYVDEAYVTDSFSRYVETSSLTFIDAEPTKPAHPEFLETEADYRDAPEGTIVTIGDESPRMKYENVWPAYVNSIARNYDLSGTRRRVLRWGNE